MSFIDWLMNSIEVSRRLTNSYYIIMAIITIIALVLLIKMKFKRFSFNLWLISGLICLFWESYLFTIGARHYHFPAIFELPYHAFTEAGPGLVIMILFAHKIKLIDISEYSDDYKEEIPKRSKKHPKGPERLVNSTPTKGKVDTEVEKPDKLDDEETEE